MDRIRGPIMVDAILAKLWKLPNWARMLGDLHDRLHAIAAPEWLPQLPDDGRRSSCTSTCTR